MKADAFYLVVAALVMLGCGFEIRAEQEPGRQVGRTAVWVDALQGEPLALEEILDDLRKVKVIYVGEYHTITRHHELEREVFEKLAKRGVQLVLAMEQFEFFNQPVLDRLNRGEIKLDELIEQASWAKRWPGYTNYLPLLTFAAREKIPVLALNARSETIRALGRGGIEKLTAEQRKELPEQVLTDDPLYEKLLNRVLGVHMAFDTQKLKPVFEAQVARDETMASRLATFLTSPASRDRTALVICGRGHCEYGLGTPARVARRIPGISQRILLLSESGDLQLTEQERKQAREVEISHQFLRELGRPPADYFQITEAYGKTKD
jgi:uncharacterized iron-regulated protein